MAFNWCWDMIPVTTDPSLSSSRRGPRDMYLVPTFWVMFTAPVLVGKLSNSGRFGFSSVKEIVTLECYEETELHVSITLPRLFIGVACVLGGGELEDNALMKENTFHFNSHKITAVMELMYVYLSSYHSLCTAHTHHTCTQHTLTSGWRKRRCCGSFLNHLCY